MAAHWLVQAVALFACIAVGVVLSALIGNWTYDVYAPIRVMYAWMAVSAAAVLLGVVAGLLAWLWVSHLFLRRRIAWIFRARSKCGGCGYMLAGLPVTEHIQVMCPECGLAADVDPALGELSGRVDASGRSLFQPAAPPTRSERARVVGRYGKRIVKWCVVAGLLAVVICGGLYLRRIAFARRQVAAARAMPGYAEELRRMLERVKPDTSPRTFGAAGISSEERVDALMQSISEALKSAIPQASQGAMYGGEWVRPRGLSMSVTTYVDPVACEKLSMQVLEAMEKAGVFDRAKELTDSDVDWRLDQDENWKQPRGGGVDLAWLFSLGEWNGARMRLAAERGDTAAWERAARNALHVAELIERRANVEDRLNAQGVEGILNSEVKGVLTGPPFPSRTMVDAAERVLAASRLGKLPTLPFEGERVRLRAAVRWLFSDEARVRSGSVDPATYQNPQQWRIAVGRLGSLEENLAAIDDLVDRTVARASAPFAPGTANLQEWKDKRAGDLAAAYSAYNFEQVLVLQRQLAIDRAGLPVMVALERFRLDQGGYPDKLEELVPVYLPAVTTDPATGKAFLYKVAKPVQPGGRSYVLYSPGPDGVDNGGAAPSLPSSLFTTYGIRNMDYIVNDPTR